MKVVFFIGSADISGGTYVIYQHALFAQEAGHDVTIATLYPFGAEQIRWHPAMHKLRFVPVEGLKDEHFDLALATWWRTAAELHCISADQYAYFIQSIESRFYPEAEAPLRALVDSTYSLGLPVVTEATWIQEFLHAGYNTKPWLVRNGIRKDLYREDGPAEAERLRQGRLRVLVEGPLGIFFKNVGSSLRLARHSKADETWLLTSTELGRYPGVKRTYSRVPIDSVPPIYRSCDLILKLSYVEGMFGPPLEMFHCGGTAIVYDVTGHDEYIRHGENAIVLRRDDKRGVLEAINRLRDDPAELERLKAGARATAGEWPDWHQSSEQFEKVLHGFMESPPVSRADVRERNAVFMADYVQAENTRLANLPKESPGTLSRALNRLNRFKRVAAFRHWTSLVREGWGPERRG